MRLNKPAKDGRLADSFGRLLLRLIMFLFFSPGDGVTTETQTTLEETSISATPVVEPVVEQIQITKTASDVEAIKDILSEMADLG